LDQPEKLLFKELHIGQMLGMKKIRTSTSGYELNERVLVRLECFNPILGRSTLQDVFFLTVDGLVRLMYNSRLPRAKEFRKWASRVLGIHLAGDRVQCCMLAASLGPGVRLVGIPDASGLYGLVLGTIGAIREPLGIPASFPNHWYVVKYGQTISRHDRMLNRHASLYGKIPGAELVLWVFKEVHRMPCEPKEEHEATLRELEDQLKFVVVQEGDCRRWTCTWAGQERKEIMLVPDLRLLAPLYDKVVDGCVMLRNAGLKDELSNLRHTNQLLAVQLEAANRLAEAANRLAGQQDKVIAAQETTICVLRSQQP
jgi:hypothetical protein